MGSSTARSLECLTFPEEFLLRLIKDMMKDLGAGAEGALSIATFYEAVESTVLMLTVTVTVEDKV